MRVVFKMSERILHDVQRDLERPHQFALERVGFISVRGTTAGNSLILIAEGYHPVADSDYVNDPTVGAMIGQEAIRKALNVALLDPVGMFHVHIHEHRGYPEFSSTDSREQLKFVPDFFNVRPDLPHGAIVLSRDRISGRVWLDLDEMIGITEFCTVGTQIKIHMGRANQARGASIRMSSRDDFSRQSFLGRCSSEILASTRATIVGLGGGGSHIAQQLAHLGVGHIRLIDPQTIEDSNLNRLVGATAKDLEVHNTKVDIAKRLIKSIRPWIDVKVSQKKWQEADYLIKDAHVLFGCVDGYQERLYLEAAARRYCLPYIDIGMDVTEITNAQYAIGGQMIVTLPDAPCMRCLGFLTRERLNQEENNYGAAGGNPQVVWTNGTLASLAIGSFVRLFTPWFNSYSNFEWLELDGNSQIVCKSQQPRYVMPEKCSHFASSDVGDPFFKICCLRREQLDGVDESSPRDQALHISGFRGIVSSLRRSFYRIAKYIAGHRS